jgi:hypothetical protein
VGFARADRLGVGDVLAVAVADALGGVAVAVADAAGDFVEPAEGLAVVVGGALAGLPGTAVGEGAPVTVGEAEPVAERVKMAGGVLDELAEQAESATQARMTEAPQPAVASRPLSTVPAMVVRTFMEPPGGSGGRRIFPRFQRSGKAPTGHKGAARGRQRDAMACSALEY